jgi:Fic family protein
MQFDKAKPYNGLPELPPSIDLETKAVLKKCISARTALAELKGVGGVIPNQALLIRSIGLQEARLSSEIENIVTTSDDLYQALADAVRAPDPAAKEVLRYQDALAAGHKSLLKQPVLTTNLFCEIAATIKQYDMNVRAMPGTKIVDGKGDVIYTPPEGAEVIRDKLKNLEYFIHAESDVDPLIKLAVIHYQFEAIHPFTDGNGRTGRIINVLYLIQQNLLTLPVLYLSRYLIEKKTEYYSGLRRVTEHGDWENWVQFVLDAVERTALQTKEKILQIKEIMDDTQEEMREKLPKIYTKDLVELIFYYPYCKTKFLEDKGFGTRHTTTSYLRALEGIGILQSQKIGRELYFINRRLLNVLKT